MKHYEEPYDSDGVHLWIEWNLESYKDFGFGLWAVLLKGQNGENDTFITIYNEPMLLMLQKLHGVTAEKELKKLDFDQRISASIHNHHH